MKKRHDLKSVQCRKDELLAHVVVIDGRKEWYFSLLHGDECVDTIKVSKM